MLREEKRRGTYLVSGGTERDWSSMPRLAVDGVNFVALCAVVLLGVMLLKGGQWCKFMG